MHYTPIFNAEAKNSAVLIDYRNNSNGPAYPIYLSAQILAKSRVYMSKLMRLADCYRNPARAIFYTDTDSLVCTPECIQVWREAGYVGKELGQMKCDLGDFTGGRFSKIVKAAWAAPKGPYSLVYVNPGESVLREKIRCKGIPHPKPPPRDTFYYEAEIACEYDQKEEKLLRQVGEWIRQPDQVEVPSGVIGKKYFVFQPAATEEDSEPKLVLARHLNIKMIEAMMAREGMVICVFGGMKKYFATREGLALQIRPDVVRRIVAKEDWWQKGHRLFKESEKDDLSALSYPAGYEL